MNSLWDDQQAEKFTDDLALRVYSSRLLGQDKTLVLHGGGNTSVKIEQENIFGDKETLLYVKGSGWDLETIEAAGFAPVRMAHLLKLAQLDKLSDSQMVNELKTQMSLASAPGPSVETILHALLPYKYVDHTHADAVISITNTAGGLERIKSVYGNKVVVIPYIMPGFDLSRLCSSIFPQQAHDETIGMVLMNHGIFSFGETAKQSYERMIELVSMAEDYLRDNNAFNVVTRDPITADNIAPLEFAGIRRELSSEMGQAMILSQQRDHQTLAFAHHPKLQQLSQQGPATPDHVIRTKRLPMLGRDFQSYIKNYKDYFKHYSKTPHDGLEKTMLDPLPRVVIDSQIGLATIGKTIKEANIVADIYQHTIDIILRASKLGGFQALPGQDIFDMEYWELEQAKLNKTGKSPQLTGEIVLITGAVSGIGKACVESFLARGAAVAGIDINSNIEALFERDDFLGLTCDVTDESALSDAIEQTVRKFGGLDMLVLNAGIFPGGCKIETLDLQEWRQVMNINLDANLSLMSKAHGYLKLAPNGGRIVVMGSKNVPAPGPGAAAYSASKAALNQLARVAALEWGRDNIRINSLHPNAVFDTAIWTDEILTARAKHYGLSVAEYKSNNLLQTEITSHDVAELAAEMCGPLFAKTTAAQVPVDGGNERVV